jgi:uncharacterized protein (DUF2236 family)
MVTTELKLPGPGSITWQINGEVILLLGWGRAILMQVAHPLVAEGVAHHSHFYTSPAAKAKRLQQTLNVMLTMTFGDREEALGAAHGIDTIHGRVNGRLEETTGPHFPAGTYYSARYPELLKWVHCTFVDSMIKTYELYVRKLSQEEKDRYLRETSVAAPMLGAPAGYFPTNTVELEKYLNEMLHNHQIMVGDRARELADYVLAPLPIPVLGKLLRWYGILPVAGLMPEKLREGYNLRWGKLEELTLAASAAGYRKLVRPWLPARLHRWPVAREAEKRAIKR